MAGPTASSAATRNPDVVWAVEDIKKRLAGRLKARRYYDGDHPLNFATKKFHNAFGEMFQELADNMCDDVVDEPTDRLQIDSWEGGQAGAIQAWWEEVKGPAKAGSVHTKARMQGDGYVIVWDNGVDTTRPIPFVQDPSQMAVRYSSSDPDKIELAAKCWPDGKGYRLNLYYPPSGEGGRGRIEHYYSRGADTTSGEKGIPQPTAFLPYQRGSEGEEGYVPPVEEHDRGMPVFHFPNGELGAYGRSALADIYPLQDALNKSICDMMVAGEKIAQQDRWATGIEILRDPVTGQEQSPFKDGKNLWWTKSKEADFGAFPSVDGKGFLEQQADLRAEIARKGGIPAHSVPSSRSSGNAPSGLGLLLQEGKIIKWGKDRQRDWGGIWAELAAYVLNWNGGNATAKDVKPVWAPVETRDEKALAETIALKRGLGVPEVQGLLELGYSEKDIKAWQREAEEHRAEQMDREGGRISAPPHGGAAALPDAPVPPNGAQEATPAGAGG